MTRFRGFPVAARLVVPTRKRKQQKQEYQDAVTANDTREYIVTTDEAVPTPPANQVSHYRTADGWREKDDTGTASDVGGGGATPDLAAVLAAGNDAGGEGIENLGPLAIDAEQGNGLSVTDATGSGYDLINAATAEGGVFRVNQRGTVIIAIDSSSNQPALDVTGSGDTATDQARWTKLGVGVVFLLDTDGRPTILAHTAPNNDNLGAGECALWFDQTDGAAKLMVRAKTADGTAVSGSVSLS